MQKRFLCFILVALSLLVGISVTACGREDNDNTSEDVEGKYYGYGVYVNEDGEEEGFIELKNGKCTISVDSPAKEHDFTVNGNYFAVDGNSESSDFRCGVAGIINNGVILIPCDGTYTMYCKEGRTPQDLFKNLSGVDGKYLSYNDGFYNQSNAMAIVGNAFVSYKHAGTVSRNGDKLKCTVTFIDKRGFVPDTDSNTVLDCDIIKNNALIVNEVYTDVESGEQYEYTSHLCKLGYDTDGNAIVGEYVVTIDPNGGFTSSLSPMQTLTINGKVYFGYIGWLHKRHNVVGYKYQCVAFNTEPDGSGIEYFEGIEIEEDTVFYAVWEELKYDM